MNIFRLKSSVLSFKNHPAEFLHGLASNTTDAPRSAFLNLHGRIIAAFDQVQISDEEIWIVVNAGYVQSVKDHLERYLKLSRVTLQVLDHCVYFDLTGDFSFDADDVFIPQKAGRLILSRKEFPSMVSEETFRLFRLKHNIPLHGVDFTDEMVLNVGHEYVSFTKGCYLGQEFVSKVHNRSKPTWKLVVKSGADCSQEERAGMTSRVPDPQTGKVFGFVFVRNDETEKR